MVLKVSSSSAIPQLGIQSPSSSENGLKRLFHPTTIGKEIGIAEDQLKEWCDWIRSSLKAPSALTKFKDHLNHKESMSRGK